ncbi:cell division ATP-binding protein FtsE [Deferribacter thermophilus]|uniref:cell division ATP-binding protein FtsE n=1 Tax=Deferribacter thermophilus TaxID=53573 RepID=UPI003C13E0F5
MIDFHNVTVSFFGDKKALNNVSFKINRGEFVYITGKSGAGKSTLLRLIYADLLPTSGVVLIAKKNLNYITESSIPYLRRNIGVIFQDFKLLEDYTVYENIKIALEIFYLEKKSMENKIIPLLHQLDIFTKRNTIVKKLSGGEKQRVAIARALINEPSIILADEPTGNLDPERAEITIKLLQNIARNGSTVIVATHDKYMIEKFPARVIELENGKIVRDLKND